MKRFYLIDLENVGRKFLEGIDRLTVEDTIVVCYNKFISKDIPKDMSDRLRYSKAMIKWLTIDNNKKNAMDFCLCVQLGHLLAEHGSMAKYYIVSNDSGFDIAKDFAQSIESKAVIKRVSSIESDLDEQEQIDKTYKQIEELLEGHKKEVIKIAQRCYNNSSTCFAYHNMLQKNLYPQEFKDVYAKTKHLYPMPEK